MQWNTQSQMCHTAQQMRGRDLFSQPAGMLNKNLSFRPNYVTRRLYQLVEEAKQEKGRHFSTFEAIHNPNESYYE